MTTSKTLTLTAVLTSKPTLSSRTLLAAIGTLVALSARCAVQPSVLGSTTRPAVDFNTVVVRHQSDIRLGAGVATTAALLALPESSRASFGRYAYELAEQIDLALGRDTLNTDGVVASLQSTIAQSESPYKAQAAYLLVALSEIVKHQTIALVDVREDSRGAEQAFKGVTSHSLKYVYEKSSWKLCCRR